MIPLKNYIQEGYVITTDDLSLSNLKSFKYWDKVKEKYPELKLIAFTIANYKEQELITESKEFQTWFEKHKDWVEIGVHGYDHDPFKKPEWERDNAEELTQKALKILKPFLAEKPLYRSPGFQTINQTVKIIEKLGFAGIAYQDRIKYFKTGEYKNVWNSHCTESDYSNPIGRIWKSL